MNLPRHPALRKMVVLGLFVLFSAVMAFVMVLVGSRVKLYLNVNPNAFAGKNAAWCRTTLQLTPAQTGRIRDILFQHKKAVNQIDREELERWQHIFATLATSSEVDLRRQIEDINLVDARRNERRLQTLLTLQKQLDEKQKQHYGQMVSALVEKYIQMLIRMFG